jgi:hypothetical protein
VEVGSVSDRNVTPSTTDSSRLAEIVARLDAAEKSAKHAWQVWPNLDGFLGYDNEITTKEQAALAAHAPYDIAWLLERESQMMGALKMMSDVALHCCDSAIGRKSLDECLRDFGFTLDEVEARDER